MFQTRDKMGVSDTADTKLNTTHQNQISSIQIQIGDKTGKYSLKIDFKKMVLSFENCVRKIIFCDLKNFWHIYVWWAVIC